MSGGDSLNIVPPTRSRSQSCSEKLDVVFLPGRFSQSCLMLTPSVYRSHCYCPWLQAGQAVVGARADHACSFAVAVVGEVAQAPHTLPHLLQHPLRDSLVSNLWLYSLKTYVEDRG